MPRWPDAQGNEAVHRWVGEEPTALNDDDFSTFVDPARGPCSRPIATPIGLNMAPMIGDVKMPYNALTDLGTSPEIARSWSKDTRNGRKPGVYLHRGSRGARGGSLSSQQPCGAADLAARAP